TPQAAHTQIRQEQPSTRGALSWVSQASSWAFLPSWPRSILRFQLGLHFFFLERARESYDVRTIGVIVLSYRYWATVGAPSFDHQPIADDHPHVTGAWGLSFSCHSEKDQVTGLLFALRHSWAEVPLILGDPGNRHTDTFVGLHGQSGAVKTIRSGTTPDIRFSALVKGPINHFLCQLVG